MTQMMNLTTGGGKVHAVAVEGQEHTRWTACAPYGHNRVSDLRWTNAPVDCKKCLASQGPRPVAPAAPAAPVELDMIWNGTPVKVIAVDGDSVTIENAKGWTRTVPAAEVGKRA